MELKGKKIVFWATALRRVQEQAARRRVLRAC